MPFFKSNVERDFETLQSKLSDRDAKIETLQTQIRLLNDQIASYEHQPESVEVIHKVGGKKNNVGGENLNTSPNKMMENSGSVSNGSSRNNSQIYQSDKDKERIEELENENQELKMKIIECETLIFSSQQRFKRTEDSLNQELSLSETKSNELENQLEYHKSIIKRLEERDKSKENVEKYQKEIEVLRQDRNFMQEQVESLVGGLESLRIDNERLKKENIEMSESLNAINLKKEDAEFQAIHTRSALQADEDRKFQEKYGLPPTEFVVTYYSCLSDKMLAGYMYITPKFVVFDTYVRVGDNYKAIQIKDITAIDKTKLGFLPGKGADLIIHTQLMSLTLRRLLMRKECVKDIMQQAHNMGHHIVSMRVGKEVEDEN
eukprot:TRINITY_DN6794_c0_g1_i1.p1 TRINITY_DN6794_c0_g1~~TRINITY_DN6794_c0_g1_i1.p1  ORF type:complete len:376 (-),score=135.32 TRINITY_DN6794_c0_g1_i1:41-1168(-)